MIYNPILNINMMNSSYIASLDTIDVFISECYAPLVPLRDIVYLSNSYLNDPSRFLTNENKKTM